MLSFRRPLPEQPRAPTSTPRDSHRPQPSSVIQSIHGLVPRNVLLTNNSNTRLARMKNIVLDTLEIIQRTSSLASDATTDAANPGLDMALSALSESLKRILTMTTTVEGVETLLSRVDILATKVKRFYSLPIERKLLEEILGQIKGLVVTWTSIAEQMKNIKSAGVIERFFNSDAEAKKLGRLVAEISSSIHDNLLLVQVLGIEENVRGIREDVGITCEDVDTVLEDTGAIWEDTGAIREDTEAIRKDVGVIHEDVEGIIEDVEIVREDMEVVRGDVAVVRDDVGVVRKDVGVVREHVEGVREDVGVISEDVGVVREDVGVVREDVGVVREDVGVVREDVRGMREELKAMRIRLDVTPSITKYAKNAQYDANVARRSCLEGTRVDVLQRLKDWIEIALTYKDLLLADGPGNVFWINGLAGTGKTTVAVSATEWCLEKGILAANFFCSRSDAECSDPKMIFVTIARQLCYFYPPFTEKVDAVLKENPDVIHAIPERQFVELILRPLEELKGTFPRAVIVLDALDECLDKAANSIILSVIAKYAQRIAQYLLFIITSRPEQQIRALFDKSREESIKNATTLLLHEVPLDTTLGDIRRYVDHEFDANAGVFEIPKGWPSTEDRDRIVALSHGLFYFVTTAIAFIMDRDHRDPEGQLDSFFGVQSGSSASGVLLYELYAQIISTSYGKASRTLAGKLPKILGAIVLAKEALSTATLANLLGYRESEVKNALSGLRSVLHIPDDSSQPIRVIHRTFPEFLLRTREQGTSASPATPDAFYVQPAEQHWLLFSRCLKTMSTLRHDMIDIRYPATFKSELRDLSTKVAATITPDLNYACRYWADHLQGGIGGAELAVDVSTLFHDFVYRKLLCWIETCSLLEALGQIATMLNTAHVACQALGGKFTSLISILVDCRRFVLTYSPCIHTAPLQVYCSALALAPTRSRVREVYYQDLGQSPILQRGAASDWEPCLAAFVAHVGNTIFSVEFSPDGSCFVSGGKDRRVKMWDVATRFELRSFDGHTDWVRSVAFSPDGEYIASGSDDKTACIWQVSSGARVHLLQGHTNWVFSVAYSADGRRILSTTWNGEVMLWDTADGRCVFALEKTGNWTDQSVLSPSGDVIARGEGASLVLHNMSSATHETFSLPEDVNACAFSPDGGYVAARTRRAIRVWATADKAVPVRSINMPDSTLSSRLAFSYNGNYIACGSLSGVIYVLEVASQDSPHTMNGHTRKVQDVAWGPDSLQLISAASDATIRLWDGALQSTIAEVSATPEHQPAPATSEHQPAPAAPTYFALQYDGNAILLHLPSLGIEEFPPHPQLPVGTPLVATFSDVNTSGNTIGQPRNEFPFHTGSWEFLTGEQSTSFGRVPISISRNGSLLAYPSSTLTTVSVFDLKTGTLVATTWRTRTVRSVTFTPDGKRLATGSSDGIVRVWDSSTGDLVCSHASHRNWVGPVAFSSNGHLVASGSYDKTIKAYEVATEQIKCTFASHMDWVVEVMFTVDDEHIVALDHSNQVNIWEIATGAHIHHFSFDDDVWRDSLTFLSNTVGIRVDCDTGVRTINMRRTNNRPVRFLESDGWVYAQRPGATHRLCWLPPEWRTIRGSWGSIVCLREAVSGAHPEGRNIIIDMSPVLAYIDSLEAE